tara:strand:- start:2732 stop:3472 length:741 start_codon:yes stop_codon:yes gene_type:complete
MSNDIKLLARRSLNRLQPEPLARKLLSGVQDGPGQAVYLLNTHMAAESLSNLHLRVALEEAEVLVADGKPISIFASRINGENIPQIPGFDLVISLLHHPAAVGKRVMAFGGTELEQNSALSALRTEGVRVLPQFFPVGFIADPTSVPEQLVDDICNFRPDIVLAFLGCPKQEIFIYQLKKIYPSIYVGLGGALQVVGGVKRRAPKLMRWLSLEWLFRLAQDPGRLWKRYATTIPLFLIYALTGKFG